MKIFFLLLAFFFQLCVFSQKYNAQANYFNKFVSSEKSIGEDCINILKNDFNIRTINGKYCISVSVIVDNNKFSLNDLDILGVKNPKILSNIISFFIPINSFSNLNNIEGIKYIEINNFELSPYLENSILSSRVDSANNGLGGLSHTYSGKGVIIAIIDWGFDYTHPMFYDTSLTNYRVVRAWDQIKNDGTPPEGYDYGVEYKGQEELLVAKSDTEYVFGYMSHGSHVAGIAGGSGGGTKYKGVAHDAEFIFVSLNRDGNSLLDAFSYINNYATMVNKPYVVNMSFGGHTGPHDGSTLRNIALDVLKGPGKIFVASAGNNGGQNFHIDKNFSSSSSDTLKTVVNFITYPDLFGQNLSMWGSKNTDFSVALRIVDNADSTIYQTPYYHSKEEPNFNDTIVLANDSLIMKILSSAKDYLSERPNINIEIKKLHNYKIVLFAISDSSHLHIWSTVKLNKRNTNWGVDLTDNYPGAKSGDIMYGIGDPMGVDKNVITIGSYKAEKKVGDLLYFGDLSSFSSKGPTIDFRNKPDISSTGENVISSINSFNIEEEPSITIDFQDKIYGFKAYSGTSMSGPMVAGIVALMLEAYPKMTPQQAKDIIFATARLDSYTGNIDTVSDLQWGWGKANALAAVKMAETLSSIDDVVIKKNIMKIYPNPTSDFIFIELDNPNHNFEKVIIFSLDGKINQEFSNIAKNFLKINVENFPVGTYLIQVINDNNEIAINKIIVSK